MITWLQALFAKDVPTQEVEYVPFTRIFTEGLLTELYTAFEKHINERHPTMPFQEKIRKDILVGNHWENVQKLCKNQGYNFEYEEIVEYLEINCYSIWYPAQAKSGHTFTDLEKSALSGYAFYMDECNEVNYPYANIDQQNEEMRQNCHPTFIESVFNINLKACLADYEKFQAKEK